MFSSICSEFRIFNRLWVAFLKAVKYKKKTRFYSYAESLWQQVRSEEKVHVRLFVRKVSKMSVCYSGIILTTITLYVLSSQLPQWTVAATNETVHRVLPYPFYVDVQSSPRYEILLGAQVVCLLTVTQTSVCVDTSIAFLIMIACGHFRLIQVRLGVIARHIEENEEERKFPKHVADDVEEIEILAKAEVDPEMTDEKIMERVRSIVVHHQETLE